MAPSVVSNVQSGVASLRIDKKGLIKEPLKDSGNLDSFQHEDLTPAIGTEFTSATQLSKLLKAENSDALIRDLAILSNSFKYNVNLVAQRGVVLFRNQDLNIEDQKRLGTKLGELSGKPTTSKLHVHPLINTSEHGEEISVIDTSQLYSYPPSN
jgi:Taurine catabolism dioxygenase TauD, TfdA family